MQTQCGDLLSEPITISSLNLPIQWLGPGLGPEGMDFPMGLSFSFSPEVKKLKQHWRNLERKQGSGGQWRRAKMKLSSYPRVS